MGKPHRDKPLPSLESERDLFRAAHLCDSPDQLSTKCYGSVIITEEREDCMNTRKAEKSSLMVENDLSLIFSHTTDFMPKLNSNGVVRTEADTKQLCTSHSDNKSLPGRHINTVSVISDNKETRRGKADDGTKNVTFSDSLTIYWPLMASSVDDKVEPLFVERVAMVVDKSEEAATTSEEAGTLASRLKSVMNDEKAARTDRMDAVRKTAERSPYSSTTEASQDDWPDIESGANQPDLIGDINSADPPPVITLGDHTSAIAAGELVRPPDPGLSNKASNAGRLTPPLKSETFECGAVNSKKRDLNDCEETMQDMLEIEKAQKSVVQRTGTVITEEDVNALRALKLQLLQQMKTKSALEQEVGSLRQQASQKTTMKSPVTSASGQNRAKSHQPHRPAAFESLVPSPSPSQLSGPDLHSQLQRQAAQLRRLAAERGAAVALSAELQRALETARQEGCSVGRDLKKVQDELTALRKEWENREKEAEKSGVELRRAKEELGKLREEGEKLRAEIVKRDSKITALLLQVSDGKMSQPLEEPPQLHNRSISSNPIQSNATPSNVTPVSTEGVAVWIGFDSESWTTDEASATEPGWGSALTEWGWAEDAGWPNSDQPASEALKLAGGQHKSEEPQGKLTFQLTAGEGTKDNSDGNNFCFEIIKDDTHRPQGDDQEDGSLHIQDDSSAPKSVLAASMVTCRRGRASRQVGLRRTPLQRIPEAEEELSSDWESESSGSSEAGEGCAGGSVDDHSVEGNGGLKSDAVIEVEEDPKTVRERVAQLESEVARLEAERQSAADHAGEMDMVATRLDAELTAVFLECEQHRRRAEAAEADSARLAGELVTARAELGRAREENCDLVRRVQDGRREIAEMRGREGQEAAGEGKEATEEREAKRSALALAEAALRELKQSADTIQRLETQLAALQANITPSQALMYQSTPSPAMHVYNSPTSAHTESTPFPPTSLEATLDRQVISFSLCSPSKSEVITPEETMADPSESHSLPIALSCAFSGTCDSGVDLTDQDLDQIDPELSGFDVADLGGDRSSSTETDPDMGRVTMLPPVGRRRNLLSDDQPTDASAAQSLFASPEPGTFYSPVHADSQSADSACRSEVRRYLRAAVSAASLSTSSLPPGAADDSRAPPPLPSLLSPLLAAETACQRLARYSELEALRLVREEERLRHEVEELRRGLLAERGLVPEAELERAVRENASLAGRLAELERAAEAGAAAEEGRRRERLAEGQEGSDDGQAGERDEARLAEMEELRREYEAVLVRLGELERAERENEALLARLAELEEVRANTDVAATEVSENVPVWADDVLKMLEIDPAAHQEVSQLPEAQDTQYFIEPSPENVFSQQEFMQQEHCTVPDQSETEKAVYPPSQLVLIESENQFYPAPIPILCQNPTNPSPLSPLQQQQQQQQEQFHPQLQLQQQQQQYLHHQEQPQQQQHEAPANQPKLFTFFRDTWPAGGAPGGPEGIWTGLSAASAAADSHSSSRHQCCHLPTAGGSSGATWQ